MYWVVWRGAEPEQMPGANEEWVAFLADLYPDVVYFKDGAEE